MSARIKGMKQLEKNIGKYIKNLQVNLSNGVFGAAEMIRQDSMNIVPKDTGDLADSSFTVGPMEVAGNSKQASAQQALLAMSRRGKSKAVTGYDTYYAVIVHEDLEAKHKPPTSAKFLEKPFRKNTPKVLEIVAREAKKE